jgi:hypothetical protein
MGTPSQAEASALEILVALQTTPNGQVSLAINPRNSPVGQAGLLLVQALETAAGVAANSTAYQARFTQCATLCTTAGVSPPSFDTTSGTLATMETAMGSAIAAFVALGSSFASVVVAAQNALADLPNQFKTITPAVAAASSGAIDTLLAQATEYIAILTAVGL